MLFLKEIQNWHDWSKVFYSIEDFKPLIREIFIKENFNFSGEVHNLTPGSNAVFLVDQYVIKIYAPKESGYQSRDDYEIELAVMEYSTKNGIPAPRLLAHGEIEDKYLFCYIIMEYIEEDISVNEISKISLDRKKLLVESVNNIMKKLNQKVDLLVPTILDKDKAIRIERMAGLHDNFITELNNLSNQVSMENTVLVHGDITRDNIIIEKNGKAILIDFADALLAPSEYELPPLIFELFQEDKEIIKEYIKNMDNNEFLDRLIDGLSIHMFGGFIIKDFFKRVQIDKSTITSINEFKELLDNTYFG